MANDVVNPGRDRPPLPGGGTDTGGMEMELSETEMRKIARQIQEEKKRQLAQLWRLVAENDLPEETVHMMSAEIKERARGRGAASNEDNESGGISPEAPEIRELLSALAAKKRSHRTTAVKKLEEHTETMAKDEELRVQEVAIRAERVKLAATKAKQTVELKKLAMEGTALDKEAHDAFHGQIWGKEAEAAGNVQQQLEKAVRNNTAPTRTTATIGQGWGPQGQARTYAAAATARGGMGPAGPMSRPARSAQGQAQQMTEMQREEANEIWPTPEWVEKGDEYTVLSVEGVPSGAYNSPGKVRNTLQTAVGPETTVGWVEFTGMTVVDVVVPVKEWGTVCKYLNDAGKKIRPDLAPHKQRSGGHGSQQVDQERATKRWHSWADGRGNRAAERVGKMLLERYPMPAAQPAPEKTPRRIAQSSQSEEGEMEDVEIARPTAAASMAGATRSHAETNTREDMDCSDVQPEVRKRRSSHTALASPNAFAVLSSDEEGGMEVVPVALGSASNTTSSAPTKDTSTPME
ncbi:hypothetical protein GGF44_004546, partial [Coemansia sp. RSA 1694]